jgi:hypothetical protein
MTAVVWARWTLCLWGEPGLRGVEECDEDEMVSSSESSKSEISIMRTI